MPRRAAGRLDRCDRAHRPSGGADDGPHDGGCAGTRRDAADRVWPRPEPVLRHGAQPALEAALARLPPAAAELRYCLSLRGHCPGQHVRHPDRPRADHLPRADHAGNRRPPGHHAISPLPRVHTPTRSSDGSTAPAMSPSPTTPSSSPGSCSISSTPQRTRASCGNLSQHQCDEHPHYHWRTAGAGSDSLTRDRASG
jgi:hypothetical protein